jgi:hypothetical protein
VSIRISIMPIFLIPVAAAGYAYYEKRKKLGKEGEEESDAGKPDEEGNDQTGCCVTTESNDGATQESWADILSRGEETSIGHKSADTADVPSWLADDSGSQQAEEPLLSAIVSKQRSGFGRYSLHSAWERRRLVLEPSRVVYYHLDSSKPHAVMELKNGVSVETNDGADCEIIFSTGDIQWRVCFDTKVQRETWLSTMQDMGKAVRKKKEQDQANRYRPRDDSATCDMEGGSYEPIAHKPSSDDDES